LVKGLQALSARLLAASSVESLWKITLDEAVQWCEADAGAWIWTTPESTVGPVYGAATCDFSTWQVALTHNEDEVEARCWGLPEGMVDFALSVPLSGEVWNGWLVLARQTPFTEDELERAGGAVALAQIAVAGMGRYERVDQARTNQMQELETVQRMGHLIGESLGLETTLDVILMMRVRSHCSTRSKVCY
jgi:hypothetical protein